MWKCLGLLYIVPDASQATELIGSAVLIGPKLALTVVHNLIDKETGRPHRHIEFVLNLEEDPTVEPSHPNRRVVTKRWHSQSPQANGSDYGLMQLSYPFQVAEYAQLTAFTPTGHYYVAGHMQQSGFSLKAQRHQMKIAYSYDQSEISYQKFSGTIGSCIYRKQLNTIRIFGMQYLTTADKNFAFVFTQQLIKQVKQLGISQRQNRHLKLSLLPDSRSERFKSQIRLSQISLIKPFWITPVTHYSSKDQSIVMKNILKFSCCQLIKISLKKIGGGYFKLLALADWPFLQEIDLSQNAISDGLKIIVKANWPKLKSINLSKNHITNTKALTLANWKRLQSINLSNNLVQQTHQIRDCFFQFVRSEWFELKHLDLSSNNLQKEQIQLVLRGKWPLLQTIIFQSNKIHKQKIDVLNEINCPRLKKISLGQNLMKIDGAQQLAKMKWQNISILDLKRCFINGRGAKAISQSHWPQLSILNLEQNNLRNEGLRFIVQANWPKLEQISLKSNYITQKGAGYLPISSWSLLKRFDISDNPILDGIQSLIKTQWPRLQYLSLMKCSAKLQNLKKHHRVIQFLTKMDWPNLKQINLQDVRTTLLDLSKIAKSNWQLIKINLRDNSISTDGLNSIIQRWPQLQQIRAGFTFQQFSPEHINFSPLREIRILHLQSNRLQDSNLNALVKCNLTCLTSLNLSNNCITTNGVKILFQAECPQLQYISIANNLIKDQGVEHLVKAGLKKLLAINLIQCLITDVGANILLAASWPLLQKLFFRIRRTQVSYLGDRLALNSCLLQTQRLLQLKWPFFDKIGFY